MSLKRLRIHVRTLYRVVALALSTCNTSSKINVVKILSNLKKAEKPNLPISFKINGSEGAILAHSLSDLFVLWEVFVAKEYDIDAGEPVKTIVDLGSNIGASVLFFLLKYPQAHIYAVEADPDIFNRLKGNFEGESRVTLIHSAVGAEDGEIAFYKNKSHLSGSVLERENTTEKVLVPALSFGALLEKYNLPSVDILKFDIEGGEFGMFCDGSATFLKRVQVIMGEVHEDISNRDKEQIILSLKSNDFSARENKLGEGRYLINAWRRVEEII